jgi:hypothetical protein
LSTETIAWGNNIPIILSGKFMELVLRIKTGYRATLRSCGSCVDFTIQDVTDFIDLVLLFQLLPFKESSP